EIGIDIKCESMHGDPAAASHTDRTNFSLSSFFIRIDPDSCLTFGATGINSIFSQCKNDDLFKIPEVVANIGIKFFKIKDRVTDNLLWSVKCDIPSAVRSEKFNTICF